MAKIELTKRGERGHEHDHEPHEEQTEPVARASVAPLVDVYENDEEMLLVADLPGVSRENLRIDVDREHLVIEGHRGDGAKRKGERELASEFRACDYRRRFTLPDGIDSAKITAQLASGILVMHLPKAAGLKPRRVEIKAR